MRKQGGLQTTVPQKREEGAVTTLEGGDYRSISSGTDFCDYRTRDSDCTHGKIMWKRIGHEGQESTINLFCCKIALSKPQARMQKPQDEHLGPVLESLQWNSPP